MKRYIGFTFRLICYKITQSVLETDMVYTIFGINNQENVACGERVTKHLRKTVSNLKKVYMF